MQKQKTEEPYYFAQVRHYLASASLNRIDVPKEEDALKEVTLLIAAINKAPNQVISLSGLLTETKSRSNLNSFERRQILWGLMNETFRLTPDRRVEVLPHDTVLT